MRPECAGGRPLGCHRHGPPALARPSGWHDSHAASKQQAACQCSSRLGPSGHCPGRRPLAACGVTVTRSRSPPHPSCSSTPRCRCHRATSALHWQAGPGRLARNGHGAGDKTLRGPLAAAVELVGAQCLLVVLTALCLTTSRSRQARSARWGGPPTPRRTYQRSARPASAAQIEQQILSSAPKCTE
jgi:hypothetical protein